MKKKSPLIVVMTTIGLFGVVAFASPTTSFFNDVIVSVKNVSQTLFSSAAKTDTRVQSQSTATKIKDEPQPQVIETIPENILWFVVFKMSEFFDKESQKLIEKGEDGKLITDYFKTKAKLSDEQASVLKEKSNAYLTKIEPIDARAKEIIEQTWAKFPKDKPISKSELPNPPKELQELQAKKDEITLLYRDSFREAIDVKSFQSFSTFLTEDFSKGAKLISSELPSGNELSPQFYLLFSGIYWDDNLLVPIVGGFGGTVFDYNTGFYYNPAVLSALYNYNTGNILHQGQDVGFAFIYPAIVLHPLYPSVSQNWYCTYSEHYADERRLRPTSDKKSDSFPNSKLFLDYPNFSDESGKQSLGAIYLNYTEVCHFVRPDQCGGFTNVPCPSSSPTPTPSPIPIEVNTVGFDGDFEILKFSGFSGVTAPPIVDPTWTKGSSTNTANVVAYTKGTEVTRGTEVGKMKLSASFTLATPPASGQPINVKVRVKNNNNVIATTQNNTSVSGSTFSIQNLQVTSALEAMPQVKKGNYTFDWEVTVDDGQTWRAAGSSEHIIYWTFDDPINPPNCRGDGILRNCTFVNGSSSRLTEFFEYAGLYDLALEKSIGSLSPETQTKGAIAKELAALIVRTSYLFV